MSNNNDDNNNDATRSCSQIFLMTFGFYCPPCSFEHTYLCPVCAVICNLLVLLFHFILPCQGGLWHWVGKNVVGWELHVPIGLRRQKQRLNGHSKEAINEIKAKKQMLKPDDYKNGERISATSPQSTLQIESQHTVSHVYVLSLPDPQRGSCLHLWKLSQWWNHNLTKSQSHSTQPQTKKNLPMRHELPVSVMRKLKITISQSLRGA